MTLLPEANSDTNQNTTTTRCLQPGQHSSGACDQAHDDNLPFATPDRHRAALPCLVSMSCPAAPAMHARHVRRQGQCSGRSTSRTGPNFAKQISMILLVFLYFANAFAFRCIFTLVMRRVPALVIAEANKRRTRC